MRGAFDFHVGSFLFSVSFPQGSKENGSRVRSRQVSFVSTLRAGSGELLILASALCEDTLWNRVVAALVPFQTSKIPRISKIRLSKAALVLAAQFFCNDDVEDYVRLPPTMVSTSEEHSHLHHAMHFDAHTCHSVGCPALSTSVRSIHSNLNLRNLLSN